MPTEHTNCFEFKISFLGILLIIHPQSHYLVEHGALGVLGMLETRKAIRFLPIKPRAPLGLFSRVEAARTGSAEDERCAL